MGDGVRRKTLGLPLQQTGFSGLPKGDSGASTIQEGGVFPALAGVDVQKARGQGERRDGSQIAAMSKSSGALLEQDPSSAAFSISAVDSRTLVRNASGSFSLDNRLLAYAVEGLFGANEQRTLTFGQLEKVKSSPGLIGALQERWYTKESMSGPVLRPDASDVIRALDQLQRDQLPASHALHFRQSAAALAERLAAGSDHSAWAQSVNGKPPQPGAKLVPGDVVIDHDGAEFTVPSNRASARAGELPSMFVNGWSIIDLANAVVRQQRGVSQPTGMQHSRVSLAEVRSFRSNPSALETLLRSTAERRGVHPTDEDRANLAHVFDLLEFSIASSVGRRTKGDGWSSPAAAPKTLSFDVVNTDGWQVAGDAAEVYERLFVPAIFQEWAPRVGELTGLKPGDKALDVATGTGVVARDLVNRVGAQGKVTGLDLNPGMLEVAGKIEPKVEWVKGDAGDLPFEDGTFDAVTSNYGLMFFPDQAKALEEMYRTLAPGGKMVVAVWGSIEKVPVYAELSDITQRHAGQTAGDIIRSPFSLGDKQELEALVKKAGLDHAQIMTQEGPFKFPSLSKMIEVEIKGSPAAAHVSDEAYEGLHAEAMQRLSHMQGPDGRVEFQTPAHLIVVEKPTES